MNKTTTQVIRILGVLIGLLWVTILYYIFPDNDPLATFNWGSFLIDKNGFMGFPFNLQVFMWLSFYVCLAELLLRRLNVGEELSGIQSFSLFHSPSMIKLHNGESWVDVNLSPNLAIKPELLAAIYEAKRDTLKNGGLIEDFFRKINYQFQSTNDVGDVYSCVNASLELALHKVDLRYTVIRYFAWLIPTLGFIGTVIGIAYALGTAGNNIGQDSLLELTIPLLATAFYTTLLALILSAIIMVILNIVQAQDEECVADVGKFCLDSIVVNLKPSSNY